MKKNKGFTIIELSITVVITIVILVATQFYKKATDENQLYGAQLTLMKLYESEKLNFKEKNQYTDDLKRLFYLQKRIPEYPVTIVDVRKRSLEKHKEPIKYFRIGNYDIDIKVAKGNQSFKITANPIKKFKDKYPVFTIDNNKKRTNPKKWTLKINE